MKCYRQMLMDEIDERIRIETSGYSMRKFAIDLELSPSYLSMLLTKKRKLTEKNAFILVSKLNWSQSKKDFFLDLVHYESTGDKASKIRIEEKEKFEEVNKLYANIETDMFLAISRWYHNAIIALTGMEGFQNDINWIAKKLKIPALEADIAIERLIRLGILKKEQDKLVVTNSLWAVGNGAPSKAIRAYHSQMLDKAKLAIEEQDVTVRDISGVTFLADSDLIPEVKERILEFRRTIVNFLSGGKKNCVYTLSTQLFRIDKP